MSQDEIQKRITECLEARRKSEEAQTTSASAYAVWTAARDVKEDAIQKMIAADDALKTALDNMAGVTKAEPIA